MEGTDIQENDHGSIKKKDENSDKNQDLVETLTKYQIQSINSEQSSKNTSKSFGNINQSMNSEQSTSKNISSSFANFDQSMNSEQSTSKNTSNSFTNVRQRTKIISEKLALKRQQLQLQNDINDIGDDNKMIANDRNVLKALETMRNSGARSVVSTQNNDLEKPLNQHSKEQLLALVNGFHKLILDLTSDNRSLTTKVKRAAERINSLKNFPIFPNKTEVSKRRTNELSSKNVIKRGSDDMNVQNLVDTTIRGSLKEKDKAKYTQADKFAKYINSMLRDYFGKDQQDKLEKYKCLPAHIEDLESFANLLVQEGYGSIVEKEIRINRKNNNQAFISMTTDRETCQKDGIITSPLARRYAFEGDIVRVLVLNRNSASNRSKKNFTSLIMGDKNLLSSDENEECIENIEDDILPESGINDTFDDSTAIVSEKENCCRAFVIRIVKQTELREIVGSVSFMHQTTINSQLYYKLTPHDVRMPMVFIPSESCTEEIKAVSKEDICGMIYVARVLDIDVSGNCIGELVQPVGKAGNLQAEIKAILFANGLKDATPYDKKYNEMYETPMATPRDEDLITREDLRKKCVFTIDPLTAKDLDDALSVEKLNNFEYEIGVHISDVSFYLKENSELDNLVKQRATSIYLVNEVIHMLPTSLCFRCSLLPGEDKFAFSVFWKWHTEKEEISAPRFTRSILNSCSQLAYEHAQKIIDNPTEELDTNDFPNLLNEWKTNDIKWRVLLLHQIAQKLKAKRYENGALAINNPKLRFQLDPKTGEPVDFEIEGRREANFLIEEFMLLANQSAAKFIHDSFPDKSILRRHSPPSAKPMKDLKDRLNNLGIDFDISSSKSVYESMQRLINEADNPKAVEACLNTLVVRPMVKALYYCSEGKLSAADFWHYALSIPIYTHFTSPIRRYPDIMVHRLIAAALNYCPPPQRTTDELHHLVKICNDQKLNAKNAGDLSIELFFKRYLKAKQSITVKAVVTEIGQNMINVVTIETNHTLSIVYKDQNCLIYKLCAPTSIDVCGEKSNVVIKLQVFSTIDVNIVFRKEKLCAFFAIPGVQNLPVVSRESSNKSKSKRKQKSRTTKKSNQNEDYNSFYAIEN